MRLWSLHPSYLDRQGLLGLWRESLLAQHVLLGKTKGYTKHPQVMRFRRRSDCLQLLCDYLHSVADDGDRRGYNLDRSKITLPPTQIEPMPVTDGQIEYEFAHLQRKLLVRSPEQHAENSIITAVAQIRLHRVFVLCVGGIEDFERL